MGFLECIGTSLPYNLGNLRSYVDSMASFDVACLVVDVYNILLSLH